MAGPLTVPIAAAALVLCIAGFAKLRSPEAAVRALRGAGLPANPSLVRAAAGGELLLGGWTVVAGGRVAAILLACAYAAFAGLALLLSRRASSCGCFGERDSPATVWHAALSAAWTLLAAAGCLAEPHPLGWFASHGSAPLAGVLAVAAVAAAHATVLAYTELPAAWGAWSAP
jgi:hypothetical protein